MDNLENQIQISHNYSILNAGGGAEIIANTTNETCIMDESVVQCLTKNIQDACPVVTHESIYVPESDCHSVRKKGNLNNRDSENNQSNNLLGKKIIEVYSAENVENIFCIDSIKQEYSVISDENGTIGVSDSHFFNQPLSYQDLNLIYTDNCILHMCDICGKGFRKKSNLKRHYRSHTGDNPHACDQCDARFPTLSRLKEHLHAHTGLRPHECDLCGKSFSRISNLTRHHRTHSAERPYQCDKCDSRFVEPTRLREHYLTHVGEKRFSCDICGKRFLKKYNLKRHHRTHTGEHPHSCATCGRGFSKRIYLLVHMETHIKNGDFPMPNQLQQNGDTLPDAIEANSAIETVASNCTVETADEIQVDTNNLQSTSDLYDVNSQINDQENRVFSCGRCGRHYIKESSLLSHQRRHEDGDLLRCKVCSATFTHASRLREHSVTHTGEKRFVCAVCKRRFGRNSNLLRHLQTHTGERRFSCEVCKKRFCNGARLREHLLSHTGEKPHRCNVCGKFFRHKFGLQRHLLTHTGEKPHKCEVCCKRFNRKGRLTAHYNKHHAETKFPNRVEPRLMNIIQNLEARLCELIKEDVQTEAVQGDRRVRHGREVKKVEARTGLRSSKRKTCPEVSECSNELEEVTVEVTSTDKCVSGTHPKLRRRTRPASTKKTTGKSNTRPCKTKLAKSKLSRESKDLLRKRSDEDLVKINVQTSQENQPNNQTSKAKASTLQNGSSTRRSAFKRNKSNLSRTSKSINRPESVITNVEKVTGTSVMSEQIEIDDLSVYQTQVIGNSLDTFVLIKGDL